VAVRERWGPIGEIECLEEEGIEAVYLRGLSLRAKRDLAHAAVTWGLAPPGDNGESSTALRAVIRAVAVALRDRRLGIEDVVRVVGPEEALRVCTVDELLVLGKAAMEAGDPVAAMHWKNAAADRLLGTTNKTGPRPIPISSPPAPSKRAARRLRTADGGEPFLMATPVPPGYAPRPIATGHVSTLADLKHPRPTKGDRSGSGLRDPRTHRSRAQQGP
jgi:hypothetical protein